MPFGESGYLKLVKVGVNIDHVALADVNIRATIALLFFFVFIILLLAQPRCKDGNRWLAPFTSARCADFWQLQRRLINHVRLLAMTSSGQGIRCLLQLSELAKEL